MTTTCYLSKSVKHLFLMLIFLWIIWITCSRSILSSVFWRLYKRYLCTYSNGRNRGILRNILAPIGETRIFYSLKKVCSEFFGEDLKIQKLYVPSIPFVKCLLSIVPLHGSPAKHLDKFSKLTKSRKFSNGFQFLRVIHSILPLNENKKKLLVIDLQIKFLYKHR